MKASTKTFLASIIALSCAGGAYAQGAGGGAGGSAGGGGGAGIGSAGATGSTGNGATGAEGGLGGARGGNTLNRPTTRHHNSGGYGSPSTGMGAGNGSTMDQRNGTSNGTGSTGTTGSTGSYTSPNDTQSGNGH